MRLQQQRTPNISFSHLLQQQQTIRSNLALSSQANSRMKEDIQSARRKLNNSSTTAMIRTNTVVNSSENNRNLVNFHHRPNRPNNFSANQPTLNTSQSQFFRRNGPQVPEEDGEHTFRLRKELNDTRKQNDGLKQVIAQNDASARFAISQLEIALQTNKAENERLKQNLKQMNDQKSYKPSNQQDASCFKCPRLQKTIRDLEAQITELNLQLNKQQTKRSQINQSNSLFRTQLSQRLRNMQQKLLRSNQQVLKYQSTIHQLTRKISQYQQKEFSIQEQFDSINHQLSFTLDSKQKMALDYQRLKIQNQRLKAQAEDIQQRHSYTVQQMNYFTNKIQAINADIGDSEDRRDRSEEMGVNIGELQERVGDLKYRLQEKIAESRQYEQRINEKDTYLKRLSQDYSQALEKIQHLEQAANHYKQRYEELQVEYERTRSVQSPSNIQTKQLQVRNQHLQQTLQKEQQKNYSLTTEIYQKDSQISLFNERLQQSNRYTNTLRQQTDKQIRGLRQQILSLQRQLYQFTSRSRQVQMQLSDVSNHLTQLKTNKVSTEYQIHQLTSQREYLRSRVEEYQEREKEINNTHFNQYKQNVQLQSYIVILQGQIAQQNDAIRNVSQEKDNIQFSLLTLQRENNRLRQQIIQQQNRSSNQQTSSHQSTAMIQNIQVQIRRYQQDNERLVMENQSLRKQAEKYYENLEQAQNYISTLTLEITQLNSSQALKDQLQQKILQNKEIENILEQQLRQKRSRQLQIRDLKEQQSNLNISILQYKSQLQQLQKDKKQANLQITRIQQTYNIYRTQIQGKITQYRKKLNQIQNQAVDQPKQNNELSSLRVKNEELYSHLTNAQNYIMTLQEKIRGIISQEQELRVTLSHEAQQRDKAERLLLAKETEIQNLNQQFNISQTTNTFNRSSSEQSSIQNLQKNIFVQQVEIKRLNAKDKDQQTYAEGLIRQLNDLKKTILEERAYRESIERQLTTKQTEQANLRKSFEQQKANRENAERKLFADEVQIKRLQTLLNKDNNSQQQLQQLFSSQKQLKEILSQERQQRQKSERFSYSLQVELKRLSSQITRASTEKDELTSLLNYTQQELQAKEQQIYRLSGECERISLQYQRISLQFHRLSGQNQRISQQLQFNLGERNKDLTSNERQSIDSYNEREHISVQQQRMREFSVENQQLKYHNTQLQQYIHNKQQQIIALRQYIQHSQETNNKPQNFSNQSIVQELKRSLGQSEVVINNLNADNIKLKQNNERIINNLSAAQDQILRLQQHLQHALNSEGALRELQGTIRNLASLNEAANQQIRQLSIQLQKSRTIQQQLRNNVQITQRSFASQTQNLKGLLALAQRDIERLRDTVQQKSSSQQNTISQQTHNKALEQINNQALIIQKVTNQLNTHKNIELTLQMQVQSLNGLLANSENERVKLQRANQQQSVENADDLSLELNHLRKYKQLCKRELENAEQEISRLSRLNQEMLQQLGNKQAQLFDLYNLPSKQKIVYIQQPLKDNRQVQFQALNRQLLSLQQQNTGLKINIQQLNSQIQSLKPSNPKFNDKGLESLIRSNQQRLSRINQLTNKLISLQQMTITGQKEKQLLKSQLQNKNNNYESLNKKIGTIVDQSEAKLRNVQGQLQEERAKLNKYKAEKEREIKGLNEENTSLKGQIQQNRSKQNQVNPLLLKLQQENGKLVQERQFFKNKLLQAEDYIHTVQTHCEKLEKELANNEPTPQVRILTQNLSQLTDNNARILQQNSKLLEEVSKYKSLIDELKSENGKLKGEHQLLQNNLIEAQRYIESIQTTILPEKQRYAHSIEEELLLRDNTIRQLRQQIQRFKIQETNRKVKQQTKLTIVEPKVSQNQFQAIKDERNRLQLSLIEAQRHIEQLHTQVIPQKQRLNIYSIQLQQNIQQKDQAIAQLQVELNTNKQQQRKTLSIIQKLEFTNNNNQKQIKQLREKEIPNLQSTLSALKSQLQQANRKINTLQANNQGAQQKNRDGQLARQLLQQKVQSLTLSLQSAQSKNEIVKSEESDQLQKLRKELENYQPKYDNLVNEIAALKRERSEQLTKLDEQLKLVEIQLGQAAKETYFFKNKLTEAEDYISYQAEIIATKGLQLTELKNKAIQDVVSVVSSDEVQIVGDDLNDKKIKAQLQSILRTVQGQNIELKSVLNTQNQAIASLQSQRNQLLQQLQQQSILIASLQANVDSHSKKIQQAEKVLNTQQKWNQQNKNKDQQTKERELKLQQTLNSLLQQTKEMKDRLSQAQTEKQLAQQNVEVVNKIKDQIKKDAQFLASKLAEAEKYISQLQNQKIPLIANQQQIANLNQQIQQLNNRNKTNEQDSNRVKAALQSKTLLLNRLEQELEEIRKKVKELQGQIIQLNADKKTAEDKVGQMDQQLRNVTADAIFFRNKLEEAQTYIAHYINQPQITPQISPSKQVQELNKIINVLTQSNRQTEAEKNKAESDRQKLDASLQETTSLIQSMRKAQDELRVQLGEVQKQKAQLISDKKKAEQIVNQVEKELKQVTQDSIFFRNKLDQAEKYIFYLQGQKKQQAQQIPIDTVPRQMLLKAQAHIQQLQRTISNINSKSEQIEPLIKENQRLTNEKRKIQEESNGILQKLSAVQAQKEILRQKGNNSQSLLDQKARQLEQLKKGYADLQVAFNRLEQKNRAIFCLPDPQDKVSKQQLTLTQNALQQVSKELYRQKQKVNRLLQELQKIKAQNEMLANENHLISQRLQKVEQQKKVAIEKTKQSQKLFFNKIEELEEEKKRLIETEDYLQKLQEEKNKGGDLPAQKDLVDKQLLIDAQNDISQLEEQNHFFKKAARELETLRPLLQALQEENRNAKQKLSELQGQNRLILQKANTSEALLITKINQFQQLKSKVSQSSTTQLENQLAAALNKIHQLQQERDGLKQSLFIISLQFDKLSNQAKTQLVENNEYKQILQGLKTDNEQAHNRAENAEQTLVQIINENNLLKSELQQKENAINELRNSMKTPNLTELQNAIRVLEYERDGLQGTNKSLVDQVERLNKIKEINDERLQSKEAEITLLHETLNQLTNQQKNESQVQASDDATFFKSKLLQAEKYIEQIQHLNYDNEQALNNQNDQIKHLEQRQAQLETILASTEQANKNLTKELERIKQLNNRLNDSNNKQISPQQFIELQSRCADLQKKIKSQMKENEQLRASIEELNQKYKEQLQEIDRLKKEKENKDSEANFFKEKLFAAETYITEIEEADNTDLTENIKQLNILQEQAKSLKKQNEALKLQNQAKSNKIDSLEKNAQQVLSEGQFFRKKLLEAETYIKHLQEELPDEENIEELRDALSQAQINAKQYQTKARDYQNRNKELNLMNQQLLNQINQHHQHQPNDQIQKLENSLVNLQSRLIETEAHNKSLQSQLNDERSSDNLSIKISPVQNSQFFKEKLLQAQSYIRQLQEENGKFTKGIETLKTQVDALKVECQQRNQILQQRQERIETLIEQLVINEQQKESLRLKNIELQQKLDPLAKKVEILDGQLVREQQANNQVIKNLANQLQLAQAKLQEANLQLQEKANALAQSKQQKEAAEQKAKKYQDLSSTLQQTLNLLDSINRPSAQQQERIENLRCQLKLAEEKLLSQTISNGAKDSVLNTLQVEINKLQQDNHDLHSRNQELESNNAALQDNNNELLKQIQELQQYSLEKDINLQEQQKKYSELSKELSELANRIQQAEQQKTLLKSSKEIADQEHETTIKELQNKIHEQIYDNRQIETQFLQQKLSQAQELILQQQNEINKLTEDIIKYQDTKQRDEDLLTTKKQEEERLDDQVRQLSNSRQILSVENKRLQQENEQLEKIANKLQSVEQEINNLVGKNINNSLQLGSREEKLTVLQEKIEALINNNESKQQKIKLLEQQLSKVAKSTEESQGKIIQLQSMNQDLKNQISNLQQQIATNSSNQNISLYNQQIEKLNKQIKELKEERQSANKHIQFVTEESSKLQQQLGEQLSQKQQKQVIISDLQQRLKELQLKQQQASQKNKQQLVILSFRLQETNSKNNELTKQLQPLKQQRQKLLAEIEQLRQALVTSQANDVQPVLNKLKQAEDYISQLQVENDNLTDTVKNLENEAPQLRKQLEDLRDSLKKTAQEKEKLISEIKELNNEMEMVQSDNERLNSKVSCLQSIIQNKDHQIADLSQFSKDLNRDKQLDKNASSDNQPPQEYARDVSAPVIPKEYQDSSQLQEERQNGLEKQGSVLVRDLQEQIQALNNELRLANQQIQRLLQQKAALQAYNKELQQQLNHRQKEDAYEELRQQLVQADRNNLELQSIHQHLLNQIESLSKDKAQLEEELRNISPPNSNLEYSSQQPKTPIKEIHQPNKNQSIQREQARLNQEIDDLKQELAEERQRNQFLLQYQVENQSLKLIKRQLENKLEDADSQRSRLLQKLKEAEDLIARLHLAQNELKLEEEQIIKQKQKLQQDLVEAELRISSLSQQHPPQNPQLLGENLKKILDLTNNFNQQVQPEDITQHLEDYPYLNEFINSILYRLRLSTALQLEKSIKIKQLTEQLQIAQKEALQAKDLKSANEFLRNQIKQLEQSIKTQDIDKQKYEQVLKELVYYETLNKQLQDKLQEITQKFQQQQKRIDGYQQHISLLQNSGTSPQENDISRQNYELRKKLESSQKLVQQFKSGGIDSSASINTKDVFYLQFLKTCLDKVVDLQMQVKEVYRQIQQVAIDSSQRSASRIEDGKGSQENTLLQDKLQELEDKLLKNAQNIRQHQQKSDHELFDLLKELTEVKQLPETNKNRIEEYLLQLQNQILREHDQHFNEVSKLRDQLANSQQQSGRSNQSLGEFHRVTREDLLKEINYLNNSIEIYHQQSMRRKKNYKRTLQSLLRDIEKLRQKQEQMIPQGRNNEEQPITQAILQITDKLKYALEKDEDEDAKQMQLGGDDFIISNNYVQILDGKDNKQEAHGLSTLKQNFAEYLEKPHQSKQTQTEEDNKPFLSFILSNQNLDKEDIRLLKKKIADMRAKDIEQNLQILRGQQKKLQEILQLGSKQNPQQLDNIILTLANNYSRDEISQIFGSQDNDEIINKLNQALCMEDSFYKGENSSTMMKDILQRKLKYYQAPTKLSEEVYTHLVNLLSTKKDDEFYDEVELLFRDLYQIEAGFEEALRKKDQIYRTHNDRMNQIFNRSSSDGSQEYLTAFERENNEGQLQMHSQKKERKVEEQEIQH